MNCQDSARILDEREVDGLLGEELSDVQAHLAVCRECARNWEIHEQLTSMEIPAVPKEMRAFYSAQTGDASHAGAFRRNRFMLIGVVVAVAAAAAMLTAQLMESPAATTASPAPKESGAAQHAIEVLPVPEPREPMRETQPVRAVGPAATAGLRILLMPPRIDSGDTTAGPAIEGFNSSLLQALRRSPDVTVDLAGATSATEQPVNRITVISPEMTDSLSSSGYRGGSENRNWTGDSGLPSWIVQVRVEPANSRVENPAMGASFPRGTFSVDLFVDSGGMPVMRGSCMVTGTPGFTGMSTQDADGGARNSNARQPICSSVDRLATGIIPTLRELTESPTDTTRLSSRLSDASLPDSERRRAYMELLNRARQSGVVLDAAATGAIRAYLAETFANKGLSATQRFTTALSVYNALIPAGPGAIGKPAAFLDLDEFTSQLIDLFEDLRTKVSQPVAGGLPGLQQPDASMVVSLLTRANPSAALDLQIRILTDNPQPSSPITIQALVALIGKRDDPRVSKVLDDVAAGKLGPELRSQLEARLAQGQRPPTQPSSFRSSPPAVEQEF